MLINIITIFPKFFKSPLEESLVKTAQKKGLIKIQVHDLRDYTHDRHKTVDDKPFGGGPGMVLKPEPIFECVEGIEKLNGKGWKIILDPKGHKLTQDLVVKLAQKKHLILIAGHYEGIDHRVHEHLVDEEISIGDFVTMGGEAPALCLMEAVARYIPGVLGNEQSLKDESFQGEGLEYPQYTRPREYRGFEVPETLISGHHQQVAQWREEEARKRTRQRRPDLIKYARRKS